MENFASNCLRPSRQLPTPVRLFLQVGVAMLCVLMPAAAFGQVTVSTQPGEWTWAGGNTHGSGAVWGTLGTPAAANIPGDRQNAAQWTDSSGNFWLFGGNGSDSLNNWGYLNDLWEYNLATNEWEWVSGSSTINCVAAGCFNPGVYGAQGTPSAGSIPGSRQDAPTWIDSSGNLWLLGGMGYDAGGTFGNLNDLWEFNPTTKLWTWMGGSSLQSGAQPGVYGTLGTAAPGNMPGGRSSAASWTDNQGNFWLFGGSGYDSKGTNGTLNDVWEFNPSTNQWTWMGGSNIVWMSGIYGSLGTPAAGNIPGARTYSLTWTDGAGNFWLFGGDGFDGNYSFGRLNDLWQFNPSTNQWTWMSGSARIGSTCQSAGSYTCGQVGVYGTLGTPAPGNMPGSRANSAEWTDSTGNLWLFGGTGYDSTGTYGDLNELWVFVPFTRQWGWMGGSNTVGVNGGQPGIYGTLGMPAAGNIPGGRADAEYWTDMSGNFWMMGGCGFNISDVPDCLDDLWEYPPANTDASPAAATPTLSLAPGNYDAVQALTIDDATSGATIYYTDNGTAPNINSLVYSGAITISSPETIEAIAVAGSYSNSGLATATYNVVLPAAATPSFSVAQGSYASAQTVTISDATSGATIYYTTDGSTPTTSSSVYSAPLVVSSTEIVEAVAVAEGYTPSAVATATYAISGSGSVPVYPPAGDMVLVSQVNWLTPLGGVGAESAYGGTLPPEASAATSMAVNSDGNVLVSNAWGNQILMLNGQTGAVTVLGSYNSNPGPVTIDSQNNLYIGGLYSPVVVKVPYNGGAYAPIVAPNLTNSGVLLTPAPCTGNDTQECAFNWNSGRTSNFLMNAADNGWFGVVSMAFDATGNFFYGLTSYSNLPNAIQECSVACQSGSVGPVVLYQEPTSSTTVQLNVGALAIDPQGNLFFTDSALDSTGTEESDSSNLNELPKSTSAGFGGVTTGFAATPTVLYTSNQSSPSNYDNQLDGVAIAPNGTVFFTTQWNGVFAFPSSGAPLTEATVATSLHTVATQGAMVLALDTTGNMYIVQWTQAINSSGVDTLARISTDNLTAPWSPVGVSVSNSPTLNPITTILNDGGCGSTPTPAVTFNATEGGAATSEFSAQANLGYCQGTMTGQSSFSTTLTFTPSAGGARSATLTATDQDGNVGDATVSGAGNQPVATPVIAPAGGVYGGAQTVSIEDATLGATIYYTTDKSAPDPTTSSVYSSPITVSSLETITAMATASGYSNSTIASAAYAIQTATPVFSLASGIYSTAQTVSLSDGTPEATIHYTTDGSTPTTSSNVYGGGIPISPSTTLKAIAVATGLLNSAVATANYDITPAAAGGTLEWTWMGGSSTVGGNCNTLAPGGPYQTTVCGRGGAYGTLGTPAAGNIPGSRVSPATWTDGSGNLWLFGGAGFDANDNDGTLNDLWRFSPNTGLWTWMGGSSTANQAGVYGTMGTPSAGSIPGGRFSPAVWIDKSGNVWLFGGGGAVDANGNSGYINDLWEYNPSTNLWTWMGGSSVLDSSGTEVSVYGTLGTPAAGNIPGGRSSTASWTDNNGNFWLFGGQGLENNGVASGDLWELNPSTLEWAWMGGNIGQQPSVYGSLGTPAAGNFPGSRTTAESWTDNSGNFWMFGGDGGNDLWEFSPSTNLWAWMGGTGTINCAPSGCAVNGVYGSLGSPASGNFPGAHNNSSNFIDKSGNLWLFGGSGTDANGSSGEMNDLWQFNPSTNQWAWMGGSSTVGSYCFNNFGSTLCGQSGIYGTLGVSAGGNFPGSRDSSTGSSGSAGWTDQNGNFWLFGGNALDANGAYGYLNDLWKYQAPLATAATPTITSVSAILPQQTQTITINGSDFGTHAAYTGDSNYIELIDTTGTSWNAGHGSSAVTLAVSSWTNTQIVLSGLSGAYGTNGWCISPGDQLSVRVWNAQTGAGPAVYPITASSGTNMCALAITSVSPILPQQTQTITINGSDFGTQAAYTGDSNYIELIDSTGTSWNAGHGTSAVTLAVSSWTNTQIVLSGLSGAYGTNGWCISPGDQLSVKVWNAQSGHGPAVYPIVASSGTNMCALAITSVSPILPQQTQTITINGSDFGTQSAYTGDSNYIELVDSTGVSWDAGHSGAAVTLAVSSWTNTQIVLTGFSSGYGTNGWCISPGDQLSVKVWNAQSGHGPAVYPIVASSGTNTCTVAITSVSAILPQQTQTITINGTGFGTQSAYTGDSKYIELADTTAHGWNAGHSGAAVTLAVSSWTDTQIVLTGLSGSYGTHGWCISPGDQLSVKVWNAQTGLGPAVYPIAASSGTDTCP
jgi:N-acetylneuraminic acid mutarotase/protein involved in polysaccharide export with SLBB domain